MGQLFCPLEERIFGCCTAEGTKTSCRFESRWCSLNIRECATTDGGAGGGAGVTDLDGGEASGDDGWDTVMRLPLSFSVSTK